MTEPVRFTSAGGVGQIIFDRPPANAYDLSFHEHFLDAIAAAEDDATTRVVIVRSALKAFFCAGADVKVFAANSTDDNKKMVDAARAALSAMEGSKKIFIALIEGHALGGGLEIAMACDMRFAAEGDYKLGLPEARLGLLPGNGGSQRLPRLVGPAMAMQLLATGENIDAVEAQRIGLVNRLFPAGDAQRATEAVAAQIAVSAPLAVTAAKRAVQEGIALPLDEALALEARLVDELYETTDAEEGFAAAVEKRDPRYRGR